MRPPRGTQHSSDRRSTASYKIGRTDLYFGYHGFCNQRGLNYPRSTQRYPQARRIQARILPQRVSSMNRRGGVISDAGPEGILLGIFRVFTPRAFLRPRKLLHQLQRDASPADPDSGANSPTESRGSGGLRRMSTGFPSDEYRAGLINYGSHLQRLHNSSHCRLDQKQRRKSKIGQRQRGDYMLWTIFVILLVLWLLGLVSSYTLGRVHTFLLVIAVVVLVINLITGRRPAL